MLSGRNKRILQSPIIGRVVELNKYMIAHGVKAPKFLQHHYVCKMWDKGSILFEYARRQADTTEYTYSGQTYTGIIALATAKNITIAS